MQQLANKLFKQVPGATGAAIPSNLAAAFNKEIPSEAVVAPQTTMETEMDCTATSKQENAGKLNESLQDAMTCSAQALAQAFQTSPELRSRSKSATRASLYAKNYAGGTAAEEVPPSSESPFRAPIINIDG